MQVLQREIRGKEWRVGWRDSVAWKAAPRVRRVCDTACGARGLRKFSGMGLCGRVKQPALP